MPNANQRVRYFPRQYLTARDFQDEQDYHVSMRRRHLLAHHTWGIVFGLELKVDAAGSTPARPEIYVESGLAVDGYGRELVKPKREGIPLSVFSEQEEDILDVYIVYGKDEADAGRAPGMCDAEVEGQDRWVERPRLLVRPHDNDAPARHKPTEFKQRSDPGPENDPPDDAAVDWPVYLGTLRRVTSDGQVTFETDLAGRPYAGLRGESIESPSGLVRVQNGSDPIAEEVQFAVRFRKTPAESCGNSRTEEAIRWDPPTFSVKQKGDIHCAGDVQVDGGLSITQGGAVAFPLANPILPDIKRFLRSDTTTFRIHHAESDDPLSNIPAQGEAATPPGDQAAAAQAETKEAAKTHELRVIIPTSGTVKSQDASARGNAFAIGVWNEEQKAFVHGLKVHENGTVEVAGDLILGGRLHERKTRVDRVLSAEARQALEVVTRSGVTAVGPTQLQNVVLAVAAALETDSGRNTALQLLFRNGDYAKKAIEQFVLLDGGLQGNAAKAALENPPLVKQLFAQLATLGEAANVAMVEGAIGDPLARASLLKAFPKINDVLKPVAVKALLVDELETLKALIAPVANLTPEEQAAALALVVKDNVVWNKIVDCFRKLSVTDQEALLAEIVENGPVLEQVAATLARLSEAKFVDVWTAACGSDDLVRQLRTLLPGSTAEANSVRTAFFEMLKKNLAANGASRSLLGEFLLAVVDQEPQPGTVLNQSLYDLLVAARFSDDTQNRGRRAVANAIQRLHEIGPEAAFGALRAYIQDVANSKIYDAFLDLVAEPTRMLNTLVASEARRDELAITLGQMAIEKSAGLAEFVSDGGQFEEQMELLFDNLAGKPDEIEALKAFLTELGDRCQELVDPDDETDE